MQRKWIWLLCGLIWLAASTPADAQWYRDKWEISPFVGYETSGQYPLSPTSSNVTVTNLQADGAVSFGTFVDYNVWDNFRAEFMWDHNPTSYSDLQAGSTGYVHAYNSNIDQFQFGGMFPIFGRQHKIRPYAAASIGFEHEFNSNGTPNRTDLSFSLGGGVEYQVTPHIAFRGDARYMPTYANTSLQEYCDPFYGCYEANAHNYQHRGNFVGGLVFSF
jgi:hypothetical protein